MRLQFLCCAIVMMTTSVFASDLSVYKWTDDKGMVHYSHAPPSGVAVTEVDVRVAYSPSVDDLKAKEESATDEVSINEKKQAAINVKNAKIFEENCKSATANKKILSNFKKILIQDENGEEKLLTGDDITERLKLTEKNIDIYCEAST